MKQIIPFKKELLFKTKVSEITSISLEHTLTLKEEDLIGGEFYITGDYKMTDGSINREKFQFKLPFNIALDSRYDMSSIIIDIDNFYYEIINNESLKVNIDVFVEGTKLENNINNDEKEVIEETVIEENNKIIEESLLRENTNDNDNDKDLFKEEITPAVEMKIPQPITIEFEEENKKNTEFNIFENIDNSDTYITYYVYIVKENDTLDKILDKYKVSKEEVANYNNLENINPGTKLIIPSTNNE